jgi:hypothetical protein
MKNAAVASSVKYLIGRISPLLRRGYHALEMLKLMLGWKMTLVGGTWLRLLDEV